MSNGTGQRSLDSLAHIANMTHELQSLNHQLNSSASPPNHGMGGSNINITAPTSTASTPPPQGSSSQSSKYAKAKKMACVECRQQKSKCDAFERQPDACTRCSKKGLKCDMKADYRRTYKRARVAQMEKEYLELKRSLSEAQAAELLVKGVQQGSPPNNHILQPQQANPQQQQQSIRHGQSSDNRGYPLPPISSTVSGLPFPQRVNQESGWQNANPSTASPFPYDVRYSHNSSDTNTSIPNTPSIYRSYEGTMNRNQSESLKMVDTKVVVPDYALVCEEKSIDTVTLPPETIRSLYVEYVERYHPILPVVDVLKGPERVYRLCPALFWTIMFVSLRRFQEDSQKSLLLELSRIVKSVLAEIMISPITRYNPTEEDEPILNASSVYSVQAFLLYSYWPPITSSLSADTSYTTTGTALFSAIRIGLHSPGAFEVSEVRQKTPQQLAMAQESAKTWIVCNIVSQTIATSFGFPAFVQFDTSLWTCRPGGPITIPKTIQLMMEIAHFEDQVARTLNSNPQDAYGLVDPAERLPLLKLLLARLDEIELKLLHELPSDDGFRRFQLLSARVHLLTYFFMDSSRIADFELKRGLVNLFNAATALINLAQYFQSKDRKFVKYLPGVHILNIWQAACIIGKLTHSPLKKVIDAGSGKQSYQAAISLAAKASIMKHDMAHRSSGIMRNMWQLFRTLDEKKMSTLSIDIRARMSASVFFDCLYLLRDQVGMTKLNSRTDQKIPEEDEEEDAEDGSSNDGEEYGYKNSDENEEAVESDTETNGVGNGGSQKSTPGSTTSSARMRKQRSLSNTVNAESNARKIIRTIPLDPQPIAVSGKRSSIFKVVNASNDSSPYVKSEGSPNFISPSNQQQHAQRSAHSERPQVTFEPLPEHTAPQLPDNIPTSSQTLPSQPAMITSNQVATAAMTPNNNFNNAQNVTEAIFNESPIQAGLENLEMDNFDMNTDMLWKDVDSVMNDFGFHTH
ncbi:hypothetical protein DFJ63DRAFT_321091 [Scheffersomyces coipomensis]|uniref:uncharacterized protein n=1 Tax=Scheffersomyces coipomensis TaxID=1788519 RepID=UPI00315D929F